jgi:anthranilate phosphoribosyltransferase
MSGPATTTRGPAPDGAAVAALFKDVLSRLGRHESLDEATANAAMGCVMDGSASPALIAGFLVGLRTRGETVAEITGCARAIRSRAAPFPGAGDDLVDTCGTGGDGSGTFNISTTAAFVAAGAGAAVAKHGNRAISSHTGSADVLEALGVDIAMSGAEAAEALAAAGVTFLFAPAFHAAMRHAAPVRRELGVRTVFNLLGPLCNPAGASAQLIGVFDAALVRPVAEAAAALGARRVMVVHGSDGLDELTVTGPSRVAEWDGTSLREYDLDPADAGLQRRDAALLKGGDAATNAAILREVLDPAAPEGPALAARRDVVLFNSAAALVVAGRAGSLAEGVGLARASIASGEARRRLDLLAASCAALAQRRRRTAPQPPLPAMPAGWGR